MENILHREMEKLQREYLQILKNAEKIINDENYNAIIDEILVFWESRKDLVCILAKHYIIPMETVVLTGITYVNMDELGHLPLMASGTRHIVDDPLCAYFKKSITIEDGTVSNIFKEQALTTLRDNVKVIETCFPYIVILPLRYVCEEPITEYAMEAFLDMFDENIGSMEDYCKLSGIKDVQNNLRIGIEKSIIFDEDEDIKESLEIRFQRFSEKSTLYDFAQNDVEKFMVVIVGYFIQALNIISMCLNFRCVPCIRYEVALKYFVMLLTNFDGQINIKDLTVKSVLLYVLYNKFDSALFDEISLDEYVLMLNSCDSQNRIFDLVGRDKIENGTATYDDISASVDLYLQELYGMIAKD